MEWGWGWGPALSPWPLSKVVKSSHIGPEWLLQLINVQRSWSLVGHAQRADVYGAEVCLLISMCVCVCVRMCNCGGGACVKCTKQKHDSFFFQGNQQRLCVCISERLMRYYNL